LSQIKASEFGLLTDNLIIVSLWATFREKFQEFSGRQTREDN